MKENEKKERRKKRRTKIHVDMRNCMNLYKNGAAQSSRSEAEARRAAPVITLFFCACHASRVIFENHDHANFF